MKKVLIAKFAVSALVLFLSASANAQSQTKSESQCGMSITELEPMIVRADSEKFSVRRIEFVGNDRLRHDLFVRRLAVKEGDLFSRKALEQTIKNINRMKQIYPITLENTEIRLASDSHDIDIAICVKERPWVK